MTAEVRLFGSLSVVVGDRTFGPRDFGGRKAKQVLEILALGGGRLVTKDQLATSLWIDNPPLDYEGCLEHYVSLLRRQLRVSTERAPAIVLTEHRGYRLGTEHVWVDIAVFDALERACAGGDDRSLVETALALMRGELLEDEPDADWALEARDRYRQRQLRLLCTAAELALQERDFDTAVRRSHSATSLDALNEASHRSLMLAHYARGERAEALRVFSDLSRSLSEDAGVDAMRATTTLRRAILEQVPVDELLPTRRRPAIEILPARSPRNPQPTPQEIPHLGPHPALKALLAACAHSRSAIRTGPVMVTVEGGTELGTSGLLDAACARMPGHRAQHVRCSPDMHHVRGALMDEIIVALLGDDAAAAAFAGELGSAVQENTVSLTAVRELEQVLAKGERFVVVVHDAQCADAFSLRLLSYIADRNNCVDGAFVLALNDELPRLEHARLSLRAMCRIRLETSSLDYLESLATMTLPDARAVRGAAVGQLGS